MKPADRRLAERLGEAAGGAEGLRLLLVYGSRARGEGRAASDWDLGFIATSTFDVDAFQAQAVDTLGTDRLDIVDLDRASGLLRYRAARDGCVLFESRAGVANEFRYAAASFWCDVAPILERGYASVLAELGP